MKPLTGASTHAMLRRFGGWRETMVPAGLRIDRCRRWPISEEDPWLMPERYDALYGYTEGRRWGQQCR